MSPQRIHRKRGKGWRKPEGAIYVGRGSRWGNPFLVHGAPGRAGTVAADGHFGHLVNLPLNRAVRTPPAGKEINAYVSTTSFLGALDTAVRHFKLLCKVRERDLPPAKVEAWIAPLRGKDLMCWCPLDQPCHADVLLDLANSGDRS